MYRFSPLVYVRKVVGALRGLQIKTVIGYTDSCYLGLYLVAAILCIFFLGLGEISQVNILVFTPSLLKTSHTTCTLNIKIRLTCLFNSYNNKFKIQVARFGFLEVRLP